MSRRTLVSMPEEAMVGGALEARASHQLRGTGWWDVAVEIRAKRPCSGCLVLLESVWSGMFKSAWCGRR